MESPGVSWRPVSHLLCGLVEVVVGNPPEIRQRPGTKTDKADASWMTERLAHGLIRPSFIPPPALQALRDREPGADPHPSQATGCDNLRGHHRQGGHRGLGPVR